MKNRTGSLGEACAARYLVQKGYTIVTSNYYSPYGEIDIVAQKDHITAFVEVKTRSSDRFAQPREAVDFRKRQRIIRTAWMYAAQYPSDTQYRFDVVEIVIRDRYGFEPVSIVHLENAFDATGALC